MPYNQNIADPKVNYYNKLISEYDNYEASNDDLESLAQTGLFDPTPSQLDYALERHQNPASDERIEYNARPLVA